MKATHHPGRIGRAVGVLLLLTMTSCGNPENPSITGIRLFTKDLERDAWVEADWSGGRVERSPILIQGNITDNTAVVDPTLAMSVSRNDLPDDAGKGGSAIPVECSPDGGEYICGRLGEGGGPFLPERSLLRGDWLEVTATSPEGSLSVVRVLFTDYGPNRTVEFKTTQQGTIDLAGRMRIAICSECTGSTGTAGCMVLGNGDSWVVDQEGSRCLEVRVDSGGISELAALWKTLTKWQVAGLLDLDYKTGFFSKEFQLIDPRTPGSAAGTASSYHVTITARDAADQKTGTVRTSSVPLSFLFDPASSESERPVLSVNEAAQGAVLERTGYSQTLSGRLLDNAGEPRELFLTVSNEPPASEAGGGGDIRTTEPYYYDMSSLSLTGIFGLSAFAVSDWDDDGMVDSAVRVWNKITLTARDRNDTDSGVSCRQDDVHCSTYSFWVAFKAPDPDTSPPQIVVAETIPAWDESGAIVLRSSEAVSDPLRIRGTAWDNAGRPDVEWLLASCRDWSSTPEENVNAPRCTLLDHGSYRPGIAGQFPPAQWEWLEIAPSDITTRTHVVLVAREKKGARSSGGEAKCTGVEIGGFVEGFESGQRTLIGVVSGADSQGPLVDLRFSRVQDGRLIEIGSGDVLGSEEHLVIEGTILPRNTTLEEIIALHNGRVETGTEAPAYQAEKAADNFSWDMGTVSLSEGDEIAVGARSVTGHRALAVIEFARTETGGLRVALSHRESNELSRTR
jgi:hypothetical protein